MSWSEIGEEERLLYAVGALPARRRLRIRLQSFLDRRLHGELRDLRRERDVYEREIGPALAGRLGRVSPSREGGGLGGRFAWEGAVSGWESGRERRKAACVWLALATLVAGCLLIFQTRELAGNEGGRSAWTYTDGHPTRPILILGY